MSCGLRKLKTVRIYSLALTTWHKVVSAQNLSLRKGLSSLAYFLLWLLCDADLFLSMDFEVCILLLSCCALESTTQLRLNAIKVKLELELAKLELNIDLIYIDI